MCSVFKFCLLELSGIFFFLDYFLSSVGTASDRQNPTVSFTFIQGLWVWTADRSDVTLFYSGD